MQREGSLLRRKGEAEAWKSRERSSKSKEVHATACRPLAGREWTGREDRRDLDRGAQPGKGRSRLEEPS